MIKSDCSICKKITLLRSRFERVCVSCYNTYSGWCTRCGAGCEHLLCEDCKKDKGLSPLLHDNYQGDTVRLSMQREMGRAVNARPIGWRAGLRMKRLRERVARDIRGLDKWTKK